MLKDFAPVFADEMEIHPETLFDNYILKEGLYIRFDLEKSLEENTRDLDYMIVAKKEELDPSKKELANWIKRRDYYSSVLNDDMNKCLDLPARKVHNTNCLTLFWKSDLLFGKNPTFKPAELQVHIDNFFNKGLSSTRETLLKVYPITGSTKAEKARNTQQRENFFANQYADLLKHLKSKYRQDIFDRARKFWQKHFVDFAIFLNNFKQTNPFSNYIKVFFVATEDFYQKEYQLYMIPRIFNINDFNVIKGDRIYGLPAYDVSMNSKKPFLELKTMRTKVPTRVSLEEAVLIKNFYKWLESKGKMSEKVLSMHSPFSPVGDDNDGAFHIRLDSSGQIDYFENVPFKSPANWDIEVDNILLRQEKEKKTGVWYTKTYDTIQSTGALHKQISKCFFAGRLATSFLNSDIPKVKGSVFTSHMQSIFVITRQSLYDFLYKGTTISIRPFILKYSRQLIEEQLCKTVEGLALYQQADAFNLRLALMKHLGLKEGEEVATLINQAYGSLTKKLNSKDKLVTCANNEEFAFLAGQLAFYLLAQSKADRKNLGMMEPILRAKNVAILKRRLEDLLDTYGHEIALGNVRFRNGFSMVMGYETNMKLEGTNRDMLLAGLMAKNLFYEKSGEEL
ncbi:hypothetical protein [Syntrophomonas erecta]